MKSTYRARIRHFIAGDRIGRMIDRMRGKRWNPAHTFFMHRNDPTVATNFLREEIVTYALESSEHGLGEHFYGTRGYLIIDGKGEYKIYGSGLVYEMEEKEVLEVLTDSSPLTWKCPHVSIDGNKVVTRFIITHDDDFDPVGSEMENMELYEKETKRYQEAIREYMTWKKGEKQIC